MKAWRLPTAGTFFCWGLWSFIPKITTRYIDPKSAIIYEVIGGFFLSTEVQNDEHQIRACRIRPSWAMNIG
jgi:transporter family protein